ncbi:mycofactocin biosynthesis glycosyltransferase MftF [Tsukamurella paurometabola]|uniref:Mycofactocin biosynthesis glycosyltransferase MftF n=1 Tax=Tsukamurella paurometabola TaxID=2061 RepID=A0ABS5NBU8_TSUPA|nr:mycofactocin biosynthesis glycosyltransferase MftF [Tsukamurella paurometabola]MBS4101107.1 mycofactocin biosynthesis glycosyltransferase MftF [Tsukamurella paurometabola]
MTAPAAVDRRLPDGFTVVLDDVVVRNGGRILIGGAPGRMLRLTPAAAARLSGPDLLVRDQGGALLARRLLDAAMAIPAPAPDSPVAGAVTVVIPVKDNQAGLTRLLSALRGLPVIVVDDGSAAPVRAPGTRVIRHARARGPAAARNAGLAAANTELVVLLDSDVVPVDGWLETLFPQFADPALAVAAPEIVALDASAPGLLAEYERARSALSLGRRAAPVAPGGRVPYVPSAALLARRSALLDVGGFDEDLRAGEDVDLCWRLRDRGWRLRYDPAAQVAHDHRVTLREWFGRRRFYGTSAAPLAARHGSRLAPLIVSPPAAATAFLLCTVRAPGVAAAAVLWSVTAIRLRRRFIGVDGAGWLAARFAARGTGAALGQLCDAALRHYWPLTAVAVVALPPVRRRVAAAAVIAGLVDWWRYRTPGGPGPLGHVVCKRLDDVAYGSGVWLGAMRGRSTSALRPARSMR